ncbi:MAG: DUF58 domain-containing protein [Bacteroidota bacterium]|nr:DUF58 domain-containing protein [Bacteroidota bacterium]MDP4214825.1 DUF58 domain-containing protein [Bacteroidota bacterium]MDP4247231.1 DUF58 domain-containing protein [Bacteroidota bacterium]MDP4253127.1 DUF58 domain-containing protein [Bacteroidota bacterium]MDP4259023.1 DUF58 domain-containing protein [Bacteroidota bacterium]
MLTTAEILKKVRELEITSKRLTRHIFTGEYHSAFKGRGMSFREVREYAAGDDIRFIDWNVSARFGHPYSKLFEEERELTVMLLVDTSASSLFGTVRARKKDLITEVCAVLAFSAINNHDKVGVIFFSDKIEAYIAPKKGRDHVLYIVRQLLTMEPRRKGTNLSEAIRFLNRSAKQKSIVFMLSDFLEDGAERFEDALKVAGKKHDLTGIKVYDKMDMQLPNIGLIEAEDAETGGLHWVDTGDFLLRSNYQRYFFDRTERCKTIFHKAGCDLLHLRADEDYVKILQRFFIGRNRPA